jgi:indole-3-glycerol phosphate synthase
MDILNEIIAHKKKEVAERKELYPVKLLERNLYFSAPAVSLRRYLMRDDKVGIIAEIKRRSPSRGIINQYVSVERTSIGYMQAGASALSVLTDTAFFGGKNEDLTTARKFNYCPILRKDFIIDEYQVIEARSIGADAILLLANVLDKKRIRELAGLARSLGMEVLLEIRDEQELGAIDPIIDVVGVNNRDLRTFKVDISQSIRLASLIPSEFIKVSESGISSVQALHRLKAEGYRGFLVGEAFMQHNRPEEACAAFIKAVKEYEPGKAIFNENALKP